MIVTIDMVTGETKVEKDKQQVAVESRNVSAEPQQFDIAPGLQPVVSEQAPQKPDHIIPIDLVNSNPQQFVDKF